MQTSQPIDLRPFAERIWLNQSLDSDPTQPGGYIMIPDNLDARTIDKLREVLQDAWARAWSQVVEAQRGKHENKPSK